jgi:flagellar motor switch protein FliN/FliY
MASRRTNKLTAEELAALVDEEPGDAGTPVRPVEFAEIEAPRGRSRAGAQAALGFILDVPLELRVVLGATRLTVRQVLDLGPGSVVELDKAYADPVDVYLNGRLVAHGEVVVAGENFGVKVTEIFSDAVESE